MKCVDGGAEHNFVPVTIHAKRGCDRSRYGDYEMLSAVCSFCGSELWVKVN